MPVTSQVSQLPSKTLSQHHSGDNNLEQHAYGEIVTQSTSFTLRAQVSLEAAPPETSNAKRQHSRHDAQD